MEIMFAINLFGILSNKMSVLEINEFQRGIVSVSNLPGAVILNNNNYYCYC